MELIEETPYRFQIPPQGDMRVPGVVFASRALLPDVSADESLHQVAQVATLPGIVGASYAMPDIHWGYGFPIGGVAATDVAGGGVVSPGGVGFDISCGVRLLAAHTGGPEEDPAAAPLRRDALGDRLAPLMDRLDRAVPRGMGRGAVWHRTSRRDLDALLRDGSRAVVDQGYGNPRDLSRCEDGGAVADADPAPLGDRAAQRGAAQVGSLGSGNHFLEVQVVDRLFDEEVAAAYGLVAGQVCVMVHCGSRGLGHQICTDHVRVMDRAMPAYGITVPDRQLACAPVESPEGTAYLGAMAAAANYARANRQVLTTAARRAFTAATGAQLGLVYDVSHNLAKVETHQVDGAPRRLCVHRKGATRALPPGHPELPADLRPVGQPVLVPGSMGTGSYVLAAAADAPAFASTCHGAGRVRSRHQAARQVRGQELRQVLEGQGVAVRGASWRGLAEEAPEAYKDIAEVVASAEGAGLGRPVARLAPVGVVKG